MVAEACHANGGHIAIEWPRACLYWRGRSVKASIRRWACTVHHFDGCMYNLRSQAAATRGKLLRKPWSIATNADFEGIGRLCDKSHAHAKTQGIDTKMTEG